MGLFRDVRKLTWVAKELQRDHDPAEQMRNARSQMQQLTYQSLLASSPTALRSPATVVEVRNTETTMNAQQLFDCDVTVRPAAGVPFAATIAVHGAAKLTMLQPGAEVTVLHEPNDAGRVAFA